MGKLEEIWPIRVMEGEKQRVNTATEMIGVSFEKGCLKIEE
jgi:hypothetical protein